MGWVRYPHATIDPNNPRALAVCDRCGFIYNRHMLRQQYQWTGPRLQDVSMVVCPTCLDKPQEQLRTIVLPADPVPIEDPRPGEFASMQISSSPVGPLTTWDVWSKGSGIVLSNGDLTAANSNAASANTQVRTAQTHISGKYYAEISITGGAAFGNIGLMSVTHPTTGSVLPGDDIYSISLIGNGGATSSYRFGGVSAILDVPFNITVCVAVDLNQGCIWWRGPGGPWNDTVFQPQSHVGGKPLGMNASPKYLVISVPDIDQSFTANFGATPYQFTVPTGFDNW